MDEKLMCGIGMVGVGILMFLTVCWIAVNYVPENSILLVVCGVVFCIVGFVMVLRFDNMEME